MVLRLPLDDGEGDEKNSLLPPHVDRLAVLAVCIDEVESLLSEAEFCSSSSQLLTLTGLFPPPPNFPPQMLLLRRPLGRKLGMISLFVAS